VYYFVKEKEVVVLAVHHGARDPRWLIERIRKSV
jgi:hypothetical protein